MRDPSEYQEDVLDVSKALDELTRTALKVKADRDALLDAAFEALDLIEGYVDVVDGDYGQPRANKAMRAQQILQAAIYKARSKP